MGIIAPSEKRRLRSRIVKAGRLSAVLGWRVRRFRGISASPHHFPLLFPAATGKSDTILLWKCCFRGRFNAKTTHFLIKRLLIGKTTKSEFCDPLGLGLLVVSE